MANGFLAGFSKGLSKASTERRKTRLELKLENKRLENQLVLQGEQEAAAAERLRTQIAAQTSEAEKSRLLQMSLQDVRLGAQEGLAAQRQAFDAKQQANLLAAEQGRLETRLGFEATQAKLKAMKLLTITVASAKANPEAHPEFFKPGAIEAVALNFAGTLSLDEVKNEFERQGIKLAAPDATRAGGLFGQAFRAVEEFGALPLGQKAEVVGEAAPKALKSFPGIQAPTGAIQGLGAELPQAEDVGRVVLQGLSGLFNIGERFTKKQQTQARSKRANKRLPKEVLGSQ